GRGRHFEAVLTAFTTRLHRATLYTALLLIARADVSSDVELLTTVTGFLTRSGRTSRVTRAMCWACVWRVPAFAHLAWRLRSWRRCRGSGLRVRGLLVARRGRTRCRLLRSLALLHGRNNLRPLECRIKHWLRRWLFRALRGFRRLLGRLD